MKIKIPFHNRFIIEIARGRKIMTTRSRRYGKIGDVFYPHKILRCILLGVERKPLKDILKFYKEEGFKSPQDFKDFWLTIHRKWQPDRIFYLHTFKRDSSWEFNKFLNSKKIKP